MMRGFFAAAIAAAAAVELVTVGAGPSDLVHGALEEAGREVVGLRPDVLGQPDERRPAGRRVEHRLHGMGQRRHDLLGLHDAIPVSG